MLLPNKSELIRQCNQVLRIAKSSNKSAQDRFKINKMIVNARDLCFCGNIFEAESLISAAIDELECF